MTISNAPSVLPPEFSTTIAKVTRSPASKSPERSLLRRFAVVSKVAGSAPGSAGSTITSLMSVEETVPENTLVCPVAIVSSLGASGITGSESGSPSKVISVLEKVNPVLSLLKATTPLRISRTGSRRLIWMIASCSIRSLKVLCCAC